MEIEAELPLTWIRLQTKALLSVTRIQSLSQHHPTQLWLADALRTRTAVIRHRSILGNIFNQFPLTTTKIESITPFIHPPWWTLRIRVQVAANKDLAKDFHNKLISQAQHNTMVIYTDGSGINDQIGAAAFNKSLNQVLHQHLSRNIHYNVYSAELAAINLGLSQWQGKSNAFQSSSMRFTPKAKTTIRTVYHCLNSG